MTEQTIQPAQLRDFEFKRVAFTGIKFSHNAADNDRGYIEQLARRISRRLTTRLGERVMRPEFGSNLYLLRDRNFDSEWRVLATRYVFDALRPEPDVSFKRLRFSTDPVTGKHGIYLEINPRD